MSSEPVAEAPVAGSSDAHPMLMRQGVASLLLLLVPALASALTGCTHRASPTVPVPFRVAAAADLVFAFEEIGKAFREQTGQPVTFSFGSTGLLAKQIAEGAPFDLFAAANTSFVDDVVTAGACDSATRTLYARGRVAAWTRAGSLGARRLEDLMEPRFARIAIANPDHAPYGRAAKEALMKIGIWDKLSSKVVYGENVQQTLTFAQSGNADAAIVALSLASVAKDGQFLLIDEGLHRPIDQALVVCKNGHNVPRAKQFAAYVGSTGGRVVMRRYGFILPGETVMNVP